MIIKYLFKGVCVSCVLFKLKFYFLNYWKNVWSFENEYFISVIIIFKNNGIVKKIIFKVLKYIYRKYIRFL